MKQELNPNAIFAREAAYARKMSGTPAPLRKAVGIFPFDLKKVSRPMVEGPKCWTESSPLTSLRSVSARIVSPKDVLLKSAPLRLTLLRLTPLRLTPLRLARLKFAKLT